MASSVAEALTGLGDLERGITRSLHGTAAPAEFYGVMRRMASIVPKLGVLVDSTPFEAALCYNKAGYAMPDSEMAVPGVMMSLNVAQIPARAVIPAKAFGELHGRACSACSI